MKRFTFTIMSLAMLMLASCDGIFGGSGEQTDTTSQPVDSTAINKEVTVTGIAVDGSRRNIFMQVDDDTLDFELPPETDFSWEIGDTITVKYFPTEYGDSITYIGSASDMTTAMR